MRILAIDTATEACSAALWQDGAVLSRFQNVGRTHTEVLLPMVHELMAEARCAFSQLDGIACGVGPGSFAGVRISVGFVKGLALALDRPVVGVSSLAMLARGAIRAGARDVLAVIDARMGEVYSGAFAASAQGQPCQAMVETVCLPARVSLPGKGSWVGVGSGWNTYREVLIRAIGITPDSVDGVALPRAEDALALALPRFESNLAISADQLTPSYLRDKVALTLLEQAKLRKDNQA